MWYASFAITSLPSIFPRWPVAGFEAIRIYYLLDKDTIRVIRILHGKRDVKRILEREGGDGSVARSETAAGADSGL